MTQIARKRKKNKKTWKNLLIHLKALEGAAKMQVIFVNLPFPLYQIWPFLPLSQVPPFSHRQSVIIHWKKAVFHWYCCIFSILLLFLPPCWENNQKSHFLMTVLTMQYFHLEKQAYTQSHHARIYPHLYFSYTSWNQPGSSRDNTKIHLWPRVHWPPLYSLSRNTTCKCHTFTCKPVYFTEDHFRT